MPETNLSEHFILEVKTSKGWEVQAYFFPHELPLALVHFKIEATTTDYLPVRLTSPTAR